MEPPTYDFSGIVSTADQSMATYLPLKSLDVHISIVDVSARVVLSQVYLHEGSGTLREAYYVFPVPARAAICSFELLTSNGVRLKGVVKELEQAKEHYQEALGKGLLAGLLEQFRQDVFVLSIGSMPPMTEVTVLLSYVVDLSEDDDIDSVRFQLSSHVRSRYGAAPNSALYHETPRRAPLTITVDIKMPGDILEITSLNHNPFVDLPIPNSLGSPGARHSRHFARKQFSAADVNLQPDFLLIVRAYGLGRPRCFAEHLSRESSRSSAGPTTALAFTIVPQFDVDTQPAQEYIFVIDRSGSMAGSRIDLAKQALQLLLEQLPANSMFNIYSFGWNFRSVWPGSKPRTDDTVRDATEEVKIMQADMGGTELFNALEDVFWSRRQDIPTCVFVLTDGGITNTHLTIQSVCAEVKKASSIAPLRVFTLGMGSGASTELCEGLAKAGNGSCMMTVEGEPLAFKATRLFKAMETPRVNAMSIDWGPGVVDQVRQAPRRIGALSPGIRLLVTAIIQGEQVPTQVTLTVGLVDGTTFNYPVPVELVSNHIPETLTKMLGGDADVPPLIHTLAAHLLIQDVEGGYTQPLELQRLATPSPEMQRNIVKRYIVELGTQYQVASSRTAFVAVAAATQSSKAPPHHGNASRRTSRSKGTSQPSSKGGSSTPSHGPESRNGHNNSTHGHTNGKSGVTSPPLSGVSAHSTSSKPSKDSPPRGGTNKLPFTSGTGGNSDNESFTTAPSKVNPSSSGAQKSSLPLQKTSTRLTSSPSHASQGKKDSVSSSNSAATQSKSPTRRIPGAFRQAPNTGTTIPGGLFDFFAYKPSPGSVLVDEVVCVPDPQGGNPMIFTAPPSYYTTITTWLKPLRSFFFSKNLGGPNRNSKKAPSAFPVMKEEVSENLLTITRLQSSDGSFPRISGELSKVVGIPESQLRNSAPSMSFGEWNESIWATAIAIAFFEKNLVKCIPLWEKTANKARHFGSRVCGSDDRFKEIIVQAALILL